MNKVPALLMVLVLLGCSKSPGSEETEQPVDEGGEYVEYNNPPAEGFNQEGSDLIATLLADKVMNAMGGREAWDATRYISWTFLGRRDHVWDKQEGNVRIEAPDRNLTILMNINSMEGKAMVNGEEVTNPDSLETYMDLGKRMWINDSYWLVMPFKLKDSGVTLTYVGEDTTETGIRSDVIRLTFEEVGVTPENAYDVWIDIDEKLVRQWAYYRSLEEAEPNFITSWEGYKKHGNILLSGVRGERELTNIKVMEELPAGTLTEFEVLIQ